ncbi:MAG: DUF1549 and DUF1553 domain-containing protein [Planctomycetes bacterium]|nr:DUF1549 and DUF1553 domain-containing protein [Planctomycetota bacterium]MCH9726878.1 DUF1549 and DUF1553 domain-containing protein [Planctomycetota bacterium]MCH9775562.1 DUF1549 and DUF1553 domain-containing protein [Planctomycetota bacterium]MCH9793584.1 DUF1549 and DUF1553 domain-containing protein [Planctomycetota bacterium]
MMSFSMKRATQIVCIFLFSVSIPLCHSSTFAATKSSSQSKNRQRVDESILAEQVDQLIEAELVKSKVKPAQLANDEDFLRRVTFDLAGRKPTTSEVILFGLDSNPLKRKTIINDLLKSEDYAVNWARYWRDVIYLRATNARSRINQNEFEAWMTTQLSENKSWDQIATDMLTATGDVRENGETALIFAHEGDPAELASETSRIFLGIQIQCANCHDHPTDKWKRNSFHELAAFFPRVRVRPVRDAMPRSFEVVSVDQGSQYDRRLQMFEDPSPLFKAFDRNRDGKLTESEVKRSRLARNFEQMLTRGDSNADKALTIKEIKNIALPANTRRATPEYLMPDLNDPTSAGKIVHPVLFIGTKAPQGLKDIKRRETLSKFLTSKSNPWFARAIVNRLWAEMLGEGFYMPIDDIGPERSALYPEVLDALADGFTANGYDLKWLYRTITNTRAYQREMQKKTPEQMHTPFAAQSPTRLRGDQIFTAITQVFGVDDLQTSRVRDRRYRGNQTARGKFSTLFTFDPSTAQDEITGDVPQALFMMNSSTINNLLGTSSNTKLAQIAKEFTNNKDAIQELYLLTLSREPSKSEMKICQDYIKSTDNRNEALEDLMWSLVNSSEFITKR